MITAAKFEKVSPARFEKDYISSLSSCPCVASESAPGAAYETVTLPVRATKGSAGYDIKTPVSFCLRPDESIKIPSGLRCKIAEGWCMIIIPKSGLGTRFRLQLDNTVGLIDQDYYDADNEGHIMISLTNDSRQGKTVDIPAGKAVVQAVFLPFGITEDDDATGIRTGGFGSTGV